jgi:hypothetical protein
MRSLVVPILVIQLLIALPTRAQADASDERAVPQFVLTGMPGFDPVILDLQNLTNDIDRARRLVSHATEEMIGAMGAAENMSLPLAITRFKNDLPPGLSFVMDGSRISIELKSDADEQAQISAQKMTKAIADIDLAKSSLALIPARLCDIHPALMRLSEEAPEAGRNAGWTTRQKLYLVKTIEMNQQAAALLPMRATDGVKQANRTLNQLNSLAD